MKYLIKESQIGEYVYQTIDNMFDKDDTYSGFVEDYDYSTGKLFKDYNKFMVWTTNDIDDDETAMRWYGENYFSESYEEGLSQKLKCPMLVLEDKYRDKLQGIFNDMWKEPMKKWFTNTFGLPVKTVE